jgi:hypothetical protein
MVRATRPVRAAAVVDADERGGSGRLGGGALEVPVQCRDLRDRSGHQSEPDDGQGRGNQT